MYIRGILRELTSPCEESDETGHCYDDHHTHDIWDSTGHGACSIPCVSLPHSCGQWVIGGPEEVRALIVDLQSVLDRWGK